MGEQTKIEWCHHTFNPWIGCAKISAGCKHCYAEHDTFARVSRGKGLELWGQMAARHVTSESNWRQPLRWNRAAVAAGERRRVFCGSLMDVFETPGMAEELRRVEDARERLWRVIEDTPQLDWLLLTKRPELIPPAVPRSWKTGFPRNVWLGTSVENQEAADERIPHLLQCPASIHFLSVEPLLGPVDLTSFSRTPGADPDEITQEDDMLGPVLGGVGGIDWVIVGGESGRGARPCHVDWIRSILAQCKEAGVACFVKQLGRIPIDPPSGQFRSFDEWVNKAQSWIGGTGAVCFDAKGRHCTRGADFARARDEGAFPVRFYLPLEIRNKKGGDWSEWSPGLRVRQFPEVRT